MILSFVVYQSYFLFVLIWALRTEHAIKRDENLCSNTVMLSLHPLKILHWKVNWSAYFVLCFIVCNGVSHRGQQRKARTLACVYAYECCPKCAFPFDASIPGNETRAGQRCIQGLRSSNAWRVSWRRMRLTFCGVFGFAWCCGSSVGIPSSPVISRDLTAGWDVNVALVLWNLPCASWCSGFACP